MKWLISSKPLNSDRDALIVRLILGGLFTWHGYDALAHYDLYLSMSRSVIGLGAHLEFNLVVFSQFICGILIVLGLFTRLAVIPIFITMTVAFFVAHKNDAFFQKELPFVYWLLCIAVFMMGSGRYSIDHHLQKRKPS